MIAAIDKFNKCLGRWVSWLTLFMVLTMFSIVIFRYTFNLGWVWLQDIVKYMHAFVFLVGAATALNQDSHVRVDVFYRNRSQKFRNWVDLLGTLGFLIPTILVIFIQSLPFVIDSWAVWEGSVDGGGLEAIFLMKSFILLFCVLLFIQSLSMVLHCLQGIRGSSND